MDKDGFLPDPESPGRDGRWRVERFTTLEALREAPCLLLLGSPGLGKTVELRGESADARRGGASTLFVDLGSTRSEERIERKVFGSAAYREWLRGSHPLHLCLDSLDEAQANIATIADLLAENLSEAPVDRLRLRVACREAERSRRLESFLATRFPGDGFASYRLLPLRRRDVQGAAEGRGLDAEAFVGDVIRHRLQALAISPITLNMLLGIVASEGALPRTRAEAYRQGCLLLCGEVSERRAAGDLSPELTPGQRLAVAARVAAAMALSGRTAVRLSPGSTGLDEISPEELAGGREVDRSTGIEAPFEVGPREVSDTLKCALFDGRGDDSMAFSHRSYEEFLAAEWISSGSLDAAQIDDLLLEKGERGQPVWPQLQGLASWLATLSQERFEWLLEHDPEAVLDTDLELVEPGRRGGVIDAWIRMRVDLPLVSHPVDRAMHDLRWPEAIGRLRDVLFDATAAIRARVVSAELIAAAGFAEVDGALADLALDRAQPHPVRVAALRALREVGGEASRRRVVPLAVTDADDDPDDLVQAVALFVAWPEVLSTAEALDAYHPPSSEYSNSFPAFFSRRLAQMPAADFATALRWVIQRSNENAVWPISTFRDNLLCVAVDGLTDPEVVEPYAELAGQMLRLRGRVANSSADYYRWQPFSRAEGRRALLESLVSRAETSDLDAATIAGDRDLIDREDRAWVAARERDAVSPVVAQAWRAIAAAIPPDRTPSFETRPAEPRKEPAPVPAVLAADAELETALDRFEAGDLDAFGVALRCIRVDDKGDSREDRDGAIDRLPGWRRQAEETRDRLVSAAEVYLEQWRDDGEVRSAARDAYSALRLARGNRPRAVDRLDDALWGRVAALAVDVDFDDGFAGWVRAEAARAAPWELRCAFDERLDREVEKMRVEGPSDDEFEFRFWPLAAKAVVLDEISDTSLSPDVRADLFTLMVDSDRADGPCLDEESVCASWLASEEGRKLVVQIASSLATVSRNGGWSWIWPLMVADEGFSKSFIAALGGRGMHGHLTDKLDARQQSDLFLAMATHYPRAVGYDAFGGFVSNQIRSWSQALIWHLSKNEDGTGLVQLDRLVEAFPEHELLRHNRYLARLAVRRAAWSPPGPREVVQLGQDFERRWVGSAAALQNAVLASLRRAQAELRGQPPAAEQLWSSRPARPKDEGALSNWVALFLRRDLAARGVVVGREVQVGAAPRGGRGDSVDLQVDAVSTDGTEPSVHSVIVEVKGCWHRELDTAIERQLVDRYLASAHRHGIYLVGWFGPAKWEDGSDERRGRCRGVAAAELEASLSESASEVSRRRGVAVAACVLDCSLGPG